MDEPPSPAPWNLRLITRRHLLPLSPIILLLLVMAAGLGAYGVFIDGQAGILPKYELDRTLLAEQRPPNSFIEGKHRLLFHSSAFLQLVTVVGSAGFALAISASNLRWKSRRFHLVLRVAALGTLGVLLLGFLGNLDAHSRLNVQFFSQTMKLDAAVTSPDHPNGGPLIKVVLATLSFWAAFLLAGAAAAVSYHILRIRKPSAMQLKKTGRAQTSILICGAALLIAQILTARAFEFWLANYAPESLAADAKAMGDAVVFGIGIFSSVALAAIYLPAHGIVVARVRVTAYQAIGKCDPKKADSWIADHGLQARFGAQVGKVAVLLGPALTGGVFEIFSII